MKFTYLPSGVLHITKASICIFAYKPKYEFTLEIALKLLIKRLTNMPFVITSRCQYKLQIPVLQKWIYMKHSEW